MNETDIVFTGKLFGITRYDERVDMKISLQGSQTSLMEQAKVCAGFLKSPAYKHFEMEIRVKVPLKTVIVKED